MIRVRVLSRAEVEAGAALGSDAVISIRSPGIGREPELDLALAQATRGESARLLRLSFDDIGMPAYGHFSGPTMAQVEEAIEFARGIEDGRSLFDGPSAEPTIIIHCEHGKSRSAAIALAILADRAGPGAERQAVNTLMRGDIDNRMHPNPLVISLADTWLLRTGRIDAALRELSPRYVRWRELWQQIIIDPDAHWDKASRILGKDRRPGS